MAVSNPFGIDLAGIGGALEARKQNALQMQLMQGQLDQQKADVSGRNALAAYFGGDQSQLGAAMAYKPEAVAAVQQRTAQLAKDQRELMVKEAPVWGQLFRDVKDEAGYATALSAAKEAGLSGVAKLPPTFDPSIVGRIVATANAFSPEKFEVKEGEGGFYQVGDRGTVRKVEGVAPKPANEPELTRLMKARDALPEGHPARATYDAAINKATTREEDRNLVSVYDPKSPTGTRMVPRAEASGQPGAPTSGLKLKTNPDGSVELVQGAGAGLPEPNSIAKPVQGDIDAALLNTSQRMDRIGLVMAQFDPKFLELPTQIGNWAKAGAEKIGIPLSEQSKAALTSYTQFRSDAANELTQTLKAMSGAAVTPQEAERLLKAIGDVDNDSPTQFKAKMDATVRSLSLAKARLNHIKANGIGEKGLTEIPLSSMQSIINKRGDELARQYQEQGKPPAEAKVLVQRQLRQEYGI